MTLRRLFPTAALLTLALLVTGCFETKDKVVLNPDGSGKVIIDALLPAAPNFGNQEEKPDAEALAKKSVSGFLRQAKGVDAWSDVSYKVTDEGKVALKATAYFPNINELKIEPTMVPVTWEKSPKGGMVLAMKPKDGAASGPASKPAELSDEQVAAKVKQAKMEYQQGKPMMQMIFGTLKLETTYELPGTVAEASIFEKTDKGAKFVVDGEKLMTAIDKMMTDDKLLAQSIRSGTKGDDPEFMMTAMWGKPGPAEVRVTGADKPQFDYKAEVKKAKEAQDEMLKKLDLDLSKPPAGPTIHMGE